jgi:hypothetical protein
MALFCIAVPFLPCGVPSDIHCLVSPAYRHEKLPDGIAAYIWCEMYE